MSDDCKKELLSDPLFINPIDGKPIDVYDFLDAYALLKEREKKMSTKEEIKL